MTIRIRPADIDVPKDDPFQNDLLDRKPPIEALIGLLGALEGPCVLALDSEWGGGKTTFLKMWAAHLRNEGYAVAEFNAWETDFSGDPFVALSSRLQKHFDEHSSYGTSAASKRFARAAKQVAIRATPILMRVLSQGLLDSGSVEKAIAELVTSHAEDRLRAFHEAQESIVNFRKTLEVEAENLSDQHEGRPLFIMIDELDRCRPSYAVELLEAAKHLFSADRIIFVLAVNRSELAHSVKALYGAEFNAEGYLHRFFDLDYILPSPNRERFVQQLLQDAGLHMDVKGGSAHQVPERTLMTRLVARSELDLRRISQMIHRLSLVCASLNNYSFYTALATASVLLIRALNSDIYRQFRSGEVPDVDMLGSLYNHGELKDLRDTQEGFILEAVISLLCFENSDAGRRNADIFQSSKLLRSCVKIREQAQSRNREARLAGTESELSEDAKRSHIRAKSVLHVFNMVRSSVRPGEFQIAVERVELLTFEEA